MNYNSGITSILVSTTAIVMVQADTMVARGIEASEIENIADKITVVIVSKDPTRSNRIVFRGSGVILNRKGNRYSVLTNAHVVRTNETYKIKAESINSSEIKTYNAKVIGKDPELDLAMLEFTSDQTHRVANLGNYGNISAGSSVYVMGWRNLGKKQDRLLEKDKLENFFGIV